MVTDLNVLVAPPRTAPARKLRVVDPVFWSHHRGGWRHVVELVAAHCDTPDGLRFVSAVEHVMASGEVIDEDWVGVIHQAPRTKALAFPDLYRLLQSPAWKASIGRCFGIWVLCEYLRDYLRAWNVSAPIGVLPYPMECPGESFDFDGFAAKPCRTVAFIGEYLRNHRAFYDLSAPGYQKLLLLPSDEEERAAVPPPPSDVVLQGRLNVADYDRLLAESVVFLNLYDGVAITTVLECIARATPVLVNRLPGVTEYLGDGYPLYYDTVEEAARWLQDDARVRDASEYLARLPTRERLTDGAFLEALTNSSIYRSLPTPPSQQQAFRTVDVTVVVCSHSRIADLPDLLGRLAAQDFAGTYEVILWNNNLARAEEVQGICNEFGSQLNLKVIHSSENYYCIIRLAVASLMRSERLLICDDDVRPEPGYIRRFVSKQQQYGPDAVICARGHVFLPHDVDEEHPERVWATGEGMRFFDESAEDRRIHFVHADNCLIPKNVLKDILQYEMTYPEFALVDDYWFSYVLGHHLELPAWKIRADDVLGFSPSSEDPSIAMYYSPAVFEERVRFYIHHMRQGWPAFGG